MLRSRAANVQWVSQQLITRIEHLHPSTIEEGLNNTERAIAPFTRTIFLLFASSALLPAYARLAVGLIAAIVAAVTPEIEHTLNRALSCNECEARGKMQVSPKKAELRVHQSFSQQ